jgi:hypothetical protein
MHLFTENLAIEIGTYYRNLALAHGVIPKVFTMVNGEGDQYLFFVDDLPLSEDEQNSFLAYIVQAHDAVCYARGTLVILDKKQQLIEYAVIDKEDLEAIVCSAELTLDLEEKPIALAEFEKSLVPKRAIFFNGLFESISLADAKLEDYYHLWDEMKSKILHRTMD